MGIAMEPEIVHLMAGAKELKMAFAKVNKLKHAVINPNLNIISCQECALTILCAEELESVLTVHVLEMTNAHLQNPLSNLLTKQAAESWNLKMLEVPADAQSTLIVTVP